MKTLHFSACVMLMMALLWSGCGSSEDATLSSKASADSTMTSVDVPVAYEVPKTTSQDPTLAPRKVDYPSGLKAALVELEVLVYDGDATGLKAMLAPDVMVNFMDGDPNIFMESWGLLDEDEVASSEVWPILDEILKGEGALVNEELGIYAFPQYYASWPEAYDILDHALVNGENVNVRATPSSEGQVVAQLSYELVKSSLMSSDAVYEEIRGERHPWIEIERVRDGLKGYVFGKYIATGYDYRLGMQAYDGQWKITYLIGGD